MTPNLKGWMVLVLLLGTLTYAIAEEITLTTYYPSPRGVYNELRTAGNVQVGRLETPGLGAPTPRLRVVQSQAEPAFRVEDEAPVVDLIDPSPFLIDADGKVGIGTASPATSASLDIVSTTKGFLPPRMTTAQRDAIVSPAAGLVIYNTTSNVHNVFNGTAWQVIGGGGFWAANGTNIFNTNTGSVGIGTTNPGAKLDVAGAVKLAPGGNDLVILGTTLNPGSKLHIQSPTLPAITFERSGGGLNALEIGG